MDGAMMMQAVAFLGLLLRCLFFCFCFFHHLLTFFTSRDQKRQVVCISHISRHAENDLECILHTHTETESGHGVGIADADGWVVEKVQKGNKKEAERS
jgi:hypothetical protein